MEAKITDNSVKERYSVHWEDVKGQDFEDFKL